MGLHVLAVNGMLIREARSYILRCHGCFKYVASSVGAGAPVEHPSLPKPVGFLKGSLAFCAGVPSTSD